MTLVQRTKKNLCKKKKPRLSTPKCSIRSSNANRWMAASLAPIWWLIRSSLCWISVESSATLNWYGTIIENKDSWILISPVSSRLSILRHGKWLQKLSAGCVRNGAMSLCFTSRAKLLLITKCWEKIKVNLLMIPIEAYLNNLTTMLTIIKDHS